MGVRSGPWCIAGSLRGTFRACYTHRVLRFDRSAPVSVHRTDDGFLRLDAYPTRCGILEYQAADGSVRRELRAPADVFAPESLATLAGAAVTVGHPGLVTPATMRRERVGVVVGNPRQDGTAVFSVLQLDDESAISRAEARELVELSCGYRCDWDPTPGVFEGQAYDGRQVNIRYNHVALLPSGKGRAGAQCSLRLDSNEDQMAEQVAAPAPEQVPAPAAVETPAPEAPAKDDKAEKLAALEAQIDRKSVV